VETPLELAGKLSDRLGNRAWLKREDTQPVFSFKLRGAYNKMARLSPEELGCGVICASAGNHAQGVALSAKRLGCRAVIVMPLTTPRLKSDAVRSLGGEVVLHGDSYSDAYLHARRVGVHRAELLGELARGGVKHTPESVVGIGRAADGRVVFLESGSSRAGLQHIVERHCGDFATRGIAEAQIPDAVMMAVTRGKVVGQVGAGNHARLVYEFEYLGKTRRIAVGEARNGSIVTAHPGS
jgi:AmiR/NasT family two-component response regulator